MSPADPHQLDADELAELEFEFLEDLMQEPTGGHNHGRKKTEEGTWTPLETDPRDAPSYKRETEPRTHGTAYTYRKIGCRCPACVAWKSEENRRRKA